MTRSPALHAGLAALVAVAVVGCGSGTSAPLAPSSPAPTPMPTPTPEPAGTIRLMGSTLAAGSTVPVAIYTGGQQAPQLSFTAAIVMRSRLEGALVRAWVRTESQRCMGGGRAQVTFEAGVERTVAPAGMSHPTVCALPYTTTYVEFEVIDGDADRPVLTERFPAVYHFVAE